MALLGSCGRVCFCGLWRVSHLGLDGNYRVSYKTGVGRQCHFWNTPVSVHARVCCNASVAAEVGSCVCEA